MSKTSLKHGVECTQKPMEYIFTFQCPTYRKNIAEIIKKNLIYELLFQLNKDCIKEIAIEHLKPTQEDKVRLLLAMNYLDDGDENERVLPLINKSVHTNGKTEIIGTYDTRSDGLECLPIKLSVFHMTLTYTDAFECVLSVTLTEKMNTLKENAFGIVLQKILGRFKTYVNSSS